MEINYPSQILRDISISHRAEILITSRREFLICKEENHQSLACDFNFLNLGVKFIWNRKLKICGNDR